MGGHHHLGQARGQMRAQGGIRDRPAGGDITHQPRVAAHFAGDHHRTGHAGISRHCGLDLSQLDPLAADLDLMVAAAKEIELPVGPPAHQIAGAIHLRGGGHGQTGLGRKRVARESLGGQFWALPIAACDPLAADM